MEFPIIVNSFSLWFSYLNFYFHILYQNSKDKNNTIYTKYNSIFKIKYTKLKEEIENTGFYIDIMMKAII